MTRNRFTSDHVGVHLREHFGQYIARNCTGKIQKVPGTDTIIIDYFDTDISPDQLADQVSQCAKSLIRANFPDKASIEFTHGEHPVLKFEGVETLEMLVQFGVRFEGWKKYATEHVASL